MKKFGRISIVAAVLFLAGLISAISVGPDDWFDSPQQSITLDQETAVVTNYGVLSGPLPVRISATRDTGEVFIGVGHAIDVDDYLGYRSVVRISGFSSFGLATQAVSEGNLALPAAPTDLDFWQTKAAGPGPQQVSGRYSVQPVQAVITKLSSGPATLKVSIGTYLPGSFAASLSLAAIGAGLLVFKWWPRKKLPNSEATETEPDQEASEAEPDSSSTSRTVTVGLSIGAAVLGLGGCAIPAMGGLPSREQLTRDPGAGLDLVAFAADYDRRNNAAIKAANSPTYSAAEWASADGELLLGSDRLSTAWAKEDKDKSAPHTCQTTINSVYSTLATQYPLTLVTTNTFVCGKPTANPTVEYSVFIRKYSYAPWVAVANVGVDTKYSVPAPRPEPATEAQRQTATTFAKAFATNLTTGGTAEPQLPAKLRKWRASELVNTSWYEESWKAQLIPNGVRTVRTERGTLSVASFLVEDVYTSTTGGISWDPPQARVYNQPGTRDRVSTWNAVTVVMELTDAPDTIPTILTWDVSDYLPD